MGALIKWVILTVVFYLILGRFWPHTDKESVSVMGLVFSLRFAVSAGVSAVLLIFLDKK